jgi:hypothetical protein
LAVTVARAFAEITDHGGVGDPRTASAEKGNRFFAVIVEQLAGLVRDLRSGKVDKFRKVGESYESTLNEIEGAQGGNCSTKSAVRHLKSE